MKTGKALLWLKSLHTLLDNSKDKVYADAIETLIESYETLRQDLNQQCHQTRIFGEQLQVFQKQEQNIMYEKKLKKYRDEIVELKKLLRDNHQSSITNSTKK